MSDLFNDDRARGERRLLCIVPDETELLTAVLDDVGCDRWVVGDLFDEKRGLTTSILVGPRAIEDFTEDWVERPGGR